MLAFKNCKAFCEAFKGVMDVAKVVNVYYKNQGLDNFHRFSGHSTIRRLGYMICWISWMTTKPLKFRKNYIT
jgi:hypothetical protein